MATKTSLIKKLRALLGAAEPNYQTITDTLNELSELAMEKDQHEQSLALADEAIFFSLNENSNKKAFEEKKLQLLTMLDALEPQDTFTAEVTRPKAFGQAEIEFTETEPAPAIKSFDRLWQVHKHFTEEFAELRKLKPAQQTGKLEDFKSTISDMLKLYDELSSPDVPHTSEYDQDILDEVSHVTTVWSEMAELIKTVPNPDAFSPADRACIEAYEQHYPQTRNPEIPTLTDEDEMSESEDAIDEFDKPNMVLHSTGKPHISFDRVNYADLVIELQDTYGKENVKYWFDDQGALKVSVNRPNAQEEFKNKLTEFADRMELVIPEHGVTDEEIDQFTQSNYHELVSKPSREELFGSDDVAATSSTYVDISQIIPAAPSPDEPSPGFKKQ